jgi:hypothetical protein
MERSRLSRDGKATVPQMGRRAHLHTDAHTVQSKGMTNTMLPAPVTVVPATVTVRTAKPRDDGQRQLRPL